MNLPLLSFKPLLIPKLWGGRRLEAYGKALPAGQAIGESWELYDRPGMSAVVAGGALDGQGLRAVMEEYGPRLLGPGLFGRDLKCFPLMLKLIDAREDLSVQVHPNDDQAAVMVGGEELGKSEMWVVLEAAPGARVAAGLKKGVGLAAFKRALDAGKVEELLQWAEVGAGDVIDIPAGRVHAIGKGCLVAEVQQNSDTTYRVWDYGRKENGKPRPLHVDEALRVINFDPDFAALPAKAQAQGLGGGRELLVENRHFSVERVKVRERFAPPPSEPAPDLLLALAGKGHLLGPSGQRAAIKAGSFCLAPAGTAWAAESAQGLTLLWARPA